MVATRWEPPPPFQDACAPGEAAFGQERGQYAGLGGPARMERFGHGTENLPHPRRLGAPVLQGFAKPISDLSRGASVEDIVATTAVALALA